MVFLALPPAPASLIAPPVPVYPKKWVSDRDLPPIGPNDEKIGVITYEMTVSKAGTPTTCRVVMTKVSPGLEQTACATLMKKASFIPARDENGEPIDALYRGFWPWPRSVMQEIKIDKIDLLVNIKSDSIRNTYDIPIPTYIVISSNGSIESCHPANAGVAQNLLDLACDQIRVHFRLISVVNQGGLPVRYLQTINLVFRASPTNKK